ncbi:MAG: PhoH family protein [Verrucomicrobiaceae bacterium]|nr:PhoH family protein [Verrucomicrobiaceae bacterium]
MPTITLEYDTPQLLQSLLAEDFNQLRHIGDAFDARTTSRDGWVKLEGTETAIGAVREVLNQLEDVLRQGGAVSPHMIQMVTTSVRDSLGSKPAQAVMDLKLQTGSRRPPVLAKTPGQIEYLRAMKDNEVTFGVGPAGTGKTFLAVAQALQCLREKTVQRLILTRPAVEAGEALGFLPGDLKEKIFPYLRPLYDALYDLVETDEAERLIERGIVEVAPLAYMRGRTLKNAFIILDEAQNTTSEQMFMFLTRLGEGSRCAVTGDPTQIDLKRNVRSGLIEAIQALPNVPGVKFVHFASADVVRLPVVQRIIEAYAKHRQHT